MPRPSFPSRKGTPSATNLVIASGDRVAADAVGLGLIRSFGRWAPVVSKPVWEQVQIMTAVALGVGQPKEGIRLVHGAGEPGFDDLVGRIRAQSGL